MDTLWNLWTIYRCETTSQLLDIKAGFVVISHQRSKVIFGLDFHALGKLFGWK